MTNEQLHEYLDQLALQVQPPDRYIVRRFTAASENGGVSFDTDLRFRGMFREREPQLEEILKRSRVLVLAEPGGGKSVIARAAVHRLIESKERVPIFAEFKEYRGDLTALIAKPAPPAILDPSSCVDGKALSRTYVLDGIDEIPSGLLPQLGIDLQKLFETDPTANLLLTARQAYYAAHNSSLPSVTSIFHILDFSDKDIAEYVAKSNLDTGQFLAAVQAADSSEEIRNPFILSVMIERYQAAGALSDRRSENLSYMIDRLIQSRPRINQHQQRRALRMLGVALETYSRNELTEEEALHVIKQAMRITDPEAHSLLDELYSSILKRTTNGLGFQMRSYGEYLAAESLEDEPLDRVKELAFLDYNTPNESWLNAMSYLVELNPKVREYFVRHYPVWTISASPSVFSPEERTSIVKSALRACGMEKQYVIRHPRINATRLARFVTDEMKRTLISNLTDPDDLVRGNALIILGLQGRPEALPIGLKIIKDRNLGVNIRSCAAISLVNVGAPRHVPELLDALLPDDPLHLKYLDVVGALIDETQIMLMLPLILQENGMLSDTFYHFREFSSREALVQTLRYFLNHPKELNSYRVEGYVMPILELLPRFFDPEIANICAEFLVRVDAEKIYPDRSGPVIKLLELIRKADREGIVPRLLLERELNREDERAQRMFYVDDLLASLMKPQTAQWLIEIRATRIIQELSPYCRGKIRDMFRPHSGGVIDAQDARAQAYRDEESKQEELQNLNVKSVQARLLTRTSLNDALADFWELKEDYWPELPETFRRRLAVEVSKQLVNLDLEKNVRWDGNTLWQPRILSILLKLIDRYALRIEPDESLIFALIGMDTSMVAKYHKRFPLSSTALMTFEKLLKTPPSGQALEGLIRFVEPSEVWSPEIQKRLSDIVSAPTDQGYIQVTALMLLVQHGVEISFVETISNSSPNQELKDHAFQALIERQHRPTIERVLAQISDDDLRNGNEDIPGLSPLGWLTKIKSDFAWPKLTHLRRRALELELPRLVGLVTEVLIGINRAKTATVIRQQAPLGPESWRSPQLAHAIEQERVAKIEKVQQTPFDDVLERLKGSTSMNRLKVICEGPTDLPVFQSLIGQTECGPNIIFDSVAGWANLRAKPDPNTWLLGCKEAILVMDGDEGRHLKKRKKPYTKIAKEEKRKLSGLAIDFRILERYGIENYFPKHVLERVTETDLTAYFPIPDHISVVAHLSIDRSNAKYRIRKFIAEKLGFPQPSPKEPLYSKNRNGDSARYMRLEDLQGTDLFDIIQGISKAARRMLDE